MLFTLLKDFKAPCMLFTLYKCIIRVYVNIGVLTTCITLFFLKIVKFYVYCALPLVRLLSKSTCFHTTFNSDIIRIVTDLDQHYPQL
jgi:hypothetical protein